MMFEKRRKKYQPINQRQNGTSGVRSTILHRKASQASHKNNLFRYRVCTLKKKIEVPPKFIFLYRKALEFSSYQPEFPIYVE